MPHDLLKKTFPLFSDNLGTRTLALRTQRNKKYEKNTYRRVTASLHKESNQLKRAMKNLEEL